MPDTLMIICREIVARLDGLAFPSRLSAQFAGEETGDASVTRAEVAIS